MKYRAWQERAPNGPWFVAVPDGGNIEIGFDAEGKPDEKHARLFAWAGNTAADKWEWLHERND